MTINEKELIENCNNSMDILSRATILAKHPYVDNVEDELQKIKDEKEEEEQQAESEYEKMLKSLKTNGEGGNANKNAKVGDE